jgi:probable S-adenosylmethionine-dependent methyltransferase, YraL family
MIGTLYIVATPIGNMEDITSRAIKTLAAVDIILAEDTRMTGKLAAHFGFRVGLMRFDAHSTSGSIEKVINFLKNGKNLALVTDAGTPAISDPGSFLVSEVVRTLGDDAKIIAIPGPSAVTAALSVSGFNSDTFTFFGFVSHKKGRTAKIKEIAECPKTTVLFESPHRIIKTISELSAISPERQAVICRELTKMFETIYRGNLSELALPEKIRPQGEFVIVLAPQK